MSERKLPFMDHLTELQHRLTRVVIAIMVGTILAFVFRDPIVLVLMEPTENFSPIAGGKPIFTEMTEMVGITMKISLVSGIILALPIVIFELVMFINPGLTSRERRGLFFLLPATLVAFGAGAAFGYFIIFPPALHFLTTFGTELATPMIRIGNYLNLIVTLLFWMGIIFEMPVVVFFLAKLGLVTAGSLVRARRYAVIVAFILGAVITPTFDPINQSLVAAPIILMYEMSILLARLARKGQKNTVIEVASDLTSTESPRKE